MFPKFSIVVVLLASILVVSAQSEKCGENEEFSRCGSVCPETCNSESHRDCTKQCIVGCFCKDGFVKGNDEKCIPKSSC
ncbi:chymotrypsin inhibitor-like [Teleopsis dalmanni]|uniref:chymotrypsin inhibitor-like n=1 Tax=Teleopsis dalmanni TaxID=139649 RepID=UPI0018CDABAB|nr:chymotrypsin inhibitor-like [Teleopsis dalmanni]XP_037944090.1 chymotrypsin inhibitor-like [Teleopsis dalmanni]